jgi:hypothetical protein
MLQKVLQFMELLVRAKRTERSICQFSPSNKVEELSTLSTALEIKEL